MQPTPGPGNPIRLVERVLDFQEAELAKVHTRGDSDRLGRAKCDAGLAISGRALAGGGFGSILGMLVMLGEDAVHGTGGMGMPGAGMLVAAGVGDLCDVGATTGGNLAVGQPEVGRPGHHHRQDGDQTDGTQGSTQSIAGVPGSGCETGRHCETIRDDERT